MSNADNLSAGSMAGKDALHTVQQQVIELSDDEEPPSGFAAPREVHGVSKEDDDASEEDFSDSESMLCDILNEETDFSSQGNKVRRHVRSLQETGLTIYVILRGS